MKFLVTWKPFETITQEQSRPHRADQGRRGFCDSQGVYMVLNDVDAAHEIPEILGPELMDNGHVEAHPIMSVEQMGEIFGEWAQQGR
jgi:hypothetical protein